MLLCPCFVNICDPICNNLKEVSDALSTAKIFSQNVTFHGYYKHQYMMIFCDIVGLELQPGGAGFQLSNPPVLETVNLLM